MKESINCSIDQSAETYITTKTEYS